MKIAFASPLAGIAACALAVGLVGCGSDGDASSPKEAPSTATTSTSPEPTASGKEGAGTSTRDAAPTLEEMRSTLEAKGLVTGTPVPMTAHLIGAKRGIKYVDQYAEIYEYDSGAKQLEAAKKGEPIDFEGSGVSLRAVGVNGNLVLIPTYGGTIPQPVVDAFTDHR